MSLTPDQISRYSRHLLLPEVGVAGQEKICNARVLCIGTGGLGSPVSLYLAAAGVGKLGLIDFDVVDKSNLQRQIAHGESTVGTLKVESAKKRIADLNSDVEVVTYNARLTAENAMEIFKEFDIIVDGTDNFPTRYLANDTCVLLGKPYIYGSILKFEGQASVFDARTGPCYRCLYPEPPPSGLFLTAPGGFFLGFIRNLFHFHIETLGQGLQLQHQDHEALRTDFILFLDIRHNLFHLVGTQDSFRYGLGQLFVLAVGTFGVAHRTPLWLFLMIRHCHRQTHTFTLRRMIATLLSK